MNRICGSRFHDFIGQLEAALHGRDSAQDLSLSAIGESMRRLVSHDDWLPDAYARPHPEFYQQYLLHVDRDQRFSVVSFVWGPGQATPIHDHLVWGVIGVLRGSELVEAFDAHDTHDVHHVRSRGAPSRMNVGDVGFVSPTIGDIHRVSNAFDDRVSISIHAYGGDIGTIRRHVYTASGEPRKTFVSGYANADELKPG
ncbi:MAG: cysteine dioxygenase [Burkholderiaceae bacterium]